MKHLKVQLILFLMFLASTRSLWLRRRYHRTSARPVHPVFDQHRPKITGGVEATPHSIPYQAGIYLSGAFCGGSLITREYVLTAAHCAMLSKNPIIYLGAHDMSVVEIGRQAIWSKRIIMHEDYQDDLLKNDIALISLEKLAILNANVKTIPIAQSNIPSLAGSLLQASGWGRTSDSSSSTSPVLRVIWIRGMTNSDCKKFYHEKYITAGTLCADTVGGKSTCRADSGGPLVDVDSSVLVGITSFNPADGFCEKGGPAGFTRVSHYTEWIRKKVSAKHPMI